MSSAFKTILYTIGTFLVIWIIFGFVATVLPWLILFGVIVYIVLKIKGAIFNKKSNNKDTYDTDYRETNENKYNSDVFQPSMEDNNTSVIDVDYKEVE